MKKQDAINLVVTAAKRVGIKEVNRKVTAKLERLEKKIAARGEKLAEEATREAKRNGGSPRSQLEALVDDQHHPDTVEIILGPALANHSAWEYSDDYEQTVQRVLKDAYKALKV